MQWLGDDRTLLSPSVDLNGDFVGLALGVESADQWHRRMRYIIRSSMHILRRLPENGVENDGNLQA